MSVAHSFIQDFCNNVLIINNTDYSPSSLYRIVIRLRWRPCRCFLPAAAPWRQLACFQSLWWRAPDTSVCPADARKKHKKNYTKWRTLATQRSDILLKTQETWIRSKVEMTSFQSLTSLTQPISLLRDSGCLCSHLLCMKPSTLSCLKIMVRWGYGPERGRC